MILQHYQSPIKFDNIDSEKYMKFENGTQFRNSIRKCIKNGVTQICVIPKNITNLENVSKQLLLYINTWSVLKREYYQKDRSGLFYISRILGLYSYLIMNKKIPMIIDMCDIYNFNENENTDLYATLFNDDNFGCLNVDMCTSENVYILNIYPIDYLFERGVNEIEYPSSHMDELANIITLNYEDFNRYYNNGLLRVMFNTDNKLFLPNQSIYNQCKLLLENYGDKILVAVHLRSFTHFKFNCDINYLDIYKTEISKLFCKSDILFVLFSDNKIYLKEISEFLIEKDIPFVILRKNIDDLCDSDGDWCSESFELSKYIGAMYDATLISMCDSVIGGRSNLTIYSMNLNKNLKLIIPETLKVDTY